MKVQQMLTNVRFYRWIFLVVFMDICRIAYGDGEIRFSSVVTNVLNTTHVEVEAWSIGYGNLKTTGWMPMLLDGIVVPEKGSSEEKNLIGILEKTLLRKKVNVLQYRGSSESDRASIYVTDDRRGFAVEDNVNLMLVREGFAQFSGKWNSRDGNLAGMAEAQRLAQEERKGIWANWTNAVQETAPEPAPPPAATDEESVAQVSSGRDGRATCDAGPGTGCARVPLTKALCYALLAAIPCLLAVLCLVKRNLRKPQ